MAPRGGIGQRKVIPDECANLEIQVLPWSLDPRLRGDDVRGEQVVGGNFALVLRKIEGRVIVHLEFLPDPKHIGPPFVGRFNLGIRIRNDSTDSRAVRAG